MGFIKSIIDQHHKKTEERNATCNELISRIDEAMREISSLLSSEEDFVEPTEEIK